MQPPPIDNPQRLVGLYAFDFGEHVSYGYTANEIAVLQNAPEHADGHAYLIVAVDPDGRMAMRGVTLADLHSEEAMVFAHSAAGAAGQSLKKLEELANDTPAPTLIRAVLADWPDFEPPHVVVMSYRQHATHAVSRWLLDIGFDGGDHVSAGAHELAAFREAGLSPKATCDLRTRFDYTSRAAQEVLESVHLPVQRP